jgi:predicted amidohydrolase
MSACQTTRIGIARWRPEPERPVPNAATAERLVAALSAQGAERVVLPGLWPSGYDARTLAADTEAAAEPLDRPRDRLLRDLAREHGLWIFAGSVPERAGGTLFDAAPTYSPDGERVGAAGGEPVRGAGPFGLLGGSRATTPDGRIIAEAPHATARPATAPKEHLVIVDLDLAAGNTAADRDTAPLWEGARPEVHLQGTGPAIDRRKN